MINTRKNGAKGKLLVVDDDQALRRLMHLELSETYEVIDTGEPEHGLALALEHLPDAILLDLRMPKYSGYELCQTFTSFSRTQAIPVVIVSGEGGAQTKEQCRQLGAAGYFEKPLDFEALKSFLGGMAKTARHLPRSEVRARLRVPLKLRGKDAQGITMTNVVDVYINYLRRKVDSGYDRVLIRTIRGVGYQIGGNCRHP